MTPVHLKLKSNSRHIKMFADSDFVVLEHANGWERRTLKQWEQDVSNLKDGEVVLDIGAYTGIYSLTAAAINPKLDIRAFEPHPNVNLRLRQNIELNSFDIQCFNIALSDSPGTAILNITGASELPSGSSLVDIGKKVLNTFEVIVVNYDNVIKTPMRLLKMDIEGNEIAALNGMRATICAYKPICFVEILSNDMHEKICRYFSSLGYTNVTHFDDHRNSSTITDISESSPPSIGKTNYRFAYKV